MRWCGSQSVFSRFLGKASLCLTITAWGLSCFLWSPKTLASVPVTQILGGAGDSFVPPPPPCASFGFTEEATLTLPTGYNVGVLIRVMQSPYNNIGWVITEDGTSQRIVTFDLTAMTLRSSFITQAAFPGKYRTGGIPKGDIDTDSRLYVFREARNGGGSCAGGAGNNCISFSRFTDNSLSSFAEAITSADATVNIDDARLHGPNKFLIINAEVTPVNGNRRVELFDKASLIKDGNGTDFGHAGFGHLSRTFNGQMYAMTNGGLANGKQIPSGSATAGGTFSMAASFGARLLGAIYGGITDAGVPNQIMGESDQTGGAQAFRAYVNETNLVNCCTGSYAVGGTNGAAIYQGTFYDPINNKVFSGRTDGASEEIIRTTPGPNTFTVEETLNCVACNYSTGSGTGSQVIDYAQHKMRLFTVSSQSPAVITRIRVCASGGPAA